MRRLKRVQARRRHHMAETRDTRHERPRELHDTPPRALLPSDIMHDHAPVGVFRSERQKPREIS